MSTKNVLPAVALLIAASLSLAWGDDAERFDHFIAHMSEVYYQPMGIDAGSVAELFDTVSPRFAAITLGYGLSKQAERVQGADARRIIFEGLIDESLSYIKLAGEAHIEKMSGGNADPKLVARYKRQLEGLFTAALAGYVDKQVEAALGAVPRVPSLFEEEAWEVAYPEVIPPVEYLAGRWGKDLIYDGKPGSGIGSAWHLTLSQGKYGYIIADQDEERFGRATQKYWRIEGNTLLIITWGGWIDGELTFSVDKGAWVFQGPWYDEDGEQKMQRGTEAKLEHRLMKKIPDRFIVQIKGAGTGAPPRHEPAKKPSGLARPGEKLTPVREAKDEAIAEEEVQPAVTHDPLAVGVTLKRFQEEVLQFDFSAARKLMTGNALQQLEYVNDWRSRNRMKFQGYKKLASMAGATFGEPQFSSDGKKAHVDAQIQLFGISLPFKLEKIELEVVDGEWKVSSIQYAKTQQD